MSPFIPARSQCQNHSDVLPYRETLAGANFRASLRRRGRDRECITVIGPACRLVGFKRGTAVMHNPVATLFFAGTRKARGDTSEKTPRRRPKTPPSRDASVQDPFSPTRANAGAFLDPIDALSQLQLQNQRQLSALLNLKILASLKAVASQNVGANPLLSSFMNFQPIPSPKPFSSKEFRDNATLGTDYRASDVQNLASYVALAQSAGLGRRSRSENSDRSDVEDRTASNLRNRTGMRRPSEPGASGDRRGAEKGRARSLSHTGGADAANNVDTEELTRRVR